MKRRLPILRKRSRRQPQKNRSPDPSGGKRRGTFAWKVMDSRNHTSHPRIGYAQLAVAAIARGAWPLFLRPAGVDASWASVIVLLAVAAVCAPLLLRVAARGPAGGEGRRRTEWWFILALGVLYAGSTMLYFIALEITTVAIAVLFHCFAPLMVVTAAPFVLGTPLRLRMLVLALVGVAGLTLVLAPWRFAGDQSAGWDNLIGAAWATGAALCGSGYLLVNKRIGARFTPEERLVYPALVAVPLLFGWGVWLQAPYPTAEGAMLVALGGASVGVAGGLFFLRGLQHVAAESAGIFMLLEPLTAVLLAWLVWSERLGITGLAGATLVGLAAAMALRERAN